MGRLDPEDLEPDDGPPESYLKQPRDGCKECSGNGAIYVSDGLSRWCFCRIATEAPESVREWVEFHYFE